MPRTTLVAFRRFPDEAAIIGRLLAGFTDLELGLMNCVQMVRDDLDTVLKAMYRSRSGRARIDIADAFGRHYYHENNLAKQFETAIAAVRYCQGIRNQYAHCVWYDDHSGKLAFVNLEEIAEKHDYVADLTTLTTKHVDTPLLEAQEDYFAYTDQLLAWVNYEGRRRTGKLPKQPIPKPKQINRPPRFIG